MNHARRVFWQHAWPGIGPVCLLIAALLSAGCATHSTGGAGPQAAAPAVEPAADPAEVEESVCSAVMEPLVFWMWSHAAGDPNPAIAPRIPNAEPVAHKTKDGRLLHGYKLRSTLPGGKVTGTLLVAQGNAMLADRVLPVLTYFSDVGIEVYIYNYRGYGDSEGKRRLKAIVSDYEELYESMRAAMPDTPHLLYGISFGGVVMANVIGSGVSYDRGVIESSPSRISEFGCPAKYNPVANLQQDDSRLLVIAGTQDRVVPLLKTQEMIDTVRARGGRAEVGEGWAHPFMDKDWRVFRTRFRLVRSFLLEDSVGAAP